MSSTAQAGRYPELRPFYRHPTLEPQTYLYRSAASSISQPFSKLPWPGGEEGELPDLVPTGHRMHQLALDFFRFDSAADCSHIRSILSLCILLRIRPCGLARIQEAEKAPPCQRWILERPFSSLVLFPSEVPDRVI